ncbi:hypothetical protein QYE76_042204 [Lolium multiflorum]|uniref:Transposase (putative) gypsy type domain-containing protein n=1 Tax=Lolium multiflorum TaxID=4521 RepID=A0AAD8TGT7_LOLMU|nr:hypothetical protein QYE76_042204 [Lolium multiflorum]
MISPNWSFMADSTSPQPKEDECILTRAWVERGLTLPCSEFFLSILSTCGLQPHNICPNSYLLLSNFVTLCEGHLGIRPDMRLWQFFFRVKKEPKDKAMLNCGSMTFMLRPGRMYPPHSSHESVRYWNAGWFYVKVPGVHEGLPTFVNKPPEEIDSWSFVPVLAHFPILDKAARRISWLVHDGLTGNDLTFSWFSRQIQLLRYSSRLICEYTGVDDDLRVSRHDLPADSLKRRIKTLVKVGRGQPVPELSKDIQVNNQCPPLNTLAEENFRSILRFPVSGEAAEEDAEDEEEEERAPKKAAPRPTKRPRAKAPGSEARVSGEASAKKAKVTKPAPLDSRKAGRDRIRLLSTSGKGSRPILPDATNPTTTTTTRTNVQKPITTYMQKSSAVGPPTPAPPSTSHAAPQPSPPRTDPSPPPAAETQVEIIPVSSEKVGGESSGTKHPAPEDTQVQGHEEMEVTSSGKAEAASSDVVVFPKNFGDPTDLTSTPKAYATKFFNKLTEAEKWDLEQDLLNAMMSNAWESLTLDQRKFRTSKRRSVSSATSFSASTRNSRRCIMSFIRISPYNAALPWQKELRGLRRYMETAEKHWDLLNTDVMGLVRDLQASSTRGAAAMCLDMCLAHNPKLNLDRVTSGVPADSYVDALLDAVSGYDRRIARRISHDEFYDKVVLLTDEPLEAELQKEEQEAEARPAESGSQYT